ESSSEDLEGYVLLSKNNTKSDTGWTVLDTIIKGQFTYSLSPELFENYYNFCIKAFDDFGNLSDCSNEVQTKIPFPSSNYVVGDVKANLNKSKVDISWNPV